MRAVKGSLDLSHEERKKQKALVGRTEEMYFARIIHEVLSRNGGVRATRARSETRVTCESCHCPSRSFRPSGLSQASALAADAS
jgi:hypothetical protein